MKAKTCFTAGMLIGLVFAKGCVKEADPPRNAAGPNATNATNAAVSGRIQIDGSSTVFPITQAVAEEFQKKHPEAKVVVGTSGTGGGFKQFCVGEIEINDASRPISEREIALCDENKVKYLELKVAIDGLSVMVHPENDWVDCLTVAQLREIWKPDSKIEKWSQLDPQWPDEKIKLFGPDTDSGTFDYFTEAVMGKSGASRADYTPSTDDNVLVRGISGERHALGYFGYAYYVENKEKLKLLGISPEDDEAACIKPTPETIEEGTYTPLSRPLFLYVNVKALKRPVVAEFLKYFLNEGQDLVGEVGYIRVSPSVLEEGRKALQAAISDDDPDAAAEPDSNEAANENAEAK